MIRKFRIVTIVLLSTLFGWLASSSKNAIIHNTLLVKFCCIFVSCHVIVM